MSTGALDQFAAHQRRRAVPCGDGHAVGALDAPGFTFVRSSATSYGFHTDTFQNTSRPPAQTR